jgi:hypothetical protein
LSTRSARSVLTSFTTTRRWNAEQAKAAAYANALRIASAKAAGLANSQTEIDVATFTQWVNAYAQKQTQLADFYFRRVRKEFRPAVEAWVATIPSRTRLRR